MRLEGIHHVSAITADVTTTVDFYATLLGLRLVWQGVNADDPTMRHIAFGDETGSPGSILTFFDMPGVARGQAGEGMVHRVAWRVADAAALEFWADRLTRAGVPTQREEASLRFRDPEGLELALVATDDGDEPLRARADEVPAKHALRGLHSLRAFASKPVASAALLAGVLGLEDQPDGQWLVRGDDRHGLYAFDPPPPDAPRHGAGTIHHVAFATRPDEHEAWRRRLVGASVRATPILDRTFFLSIYFREPSGVLLELATQGPGFVLEPVEHLGETLTLIGGLEHLRPQLEQRFPPIPNPRAASSSTTPASGVPAG
jgi:glyoxalase family protein